ncbi:MAG: undecaprenyl/decaprenyl-phosphate alpha-N-acetylglucosaminyl 1-phosphate transferase [Woeseia sp.]|nr:undecaprenyl/decaprenyl-phosphate alpha-N-acetylglucosaminyl 1-phosphate transferase [Woeseia sp.]MBT8095876.1 undecaprenyl/decaprenyl-phosphate alpha-N-acetylglucosaminyl 1-phosphate transferase [Woeseia sp.]NNE61975.1 undecaprenyl/decaprenyl-phosphate alpha-N-acetylglucosaminyl 1-phosphate transferase [Woeseia sp.]NNL56020.1 undecaprenyl/decaprenyl-phosphate alpha-N-acetylglucosaminyl 1-phosphate transferase [Woeseia sp.]
MAISAIFTLILALGSTALCIALLKPVAARFGLLDHPDHRKNHDGAIPQIGGIAIWIAFAICLLFIGVTVKLAVLLLSGGLLMVIGAVDDAKDLPPQFRLVLHIGAALIVSVFGGVVVQTLGDLVIPGFDIDLGLLAIPFTVFAVVAMINATNMSDGLDGLCGLQLIIPLVGLAVLSGLSNDQEHFLPLLAICGCLLGFLFFNLRTPWSGRATVFLGDAGSNFLGLLLAWFLIDMSQGENAVLQPVAVLWFALLLIYDTLEVVARRMIRGKSPFSADREHLHHVFLLARFTPTETVFTMGGITLVGVLIGMSTAFISIPDSVLFAAFILFGVLFLRWIFHTWSVMRFLYRSICRRSGERRSRQTEFWDGEDRRAGVDRRDRATAVRRESDRRVDET